MSEIPPADRYFEDFAVGDLFTLGSVTVDEAEMLEFSRFYDPQPFHIDPDAAAESHFGGIIASGWHTGSMMMRLLTEGFLGVSSMGSPGLESLAWPTPVRAHDVLTLGVEVLDSRASKTKPHMGILKVRQFLLNQNGDLAFDATAVMMIARRQG